LKRSVFNNLRRPKSYFCPQKQEFEDLFGFRPKIPERSVDTHAQKAVSARERWPNFPADLSVTPTRFLMRAIPTTSPRRRPRQARAQATVDAIVKATARVLVDEGYDRASTNRVALAAGVSIGSLYQYFPSKEALVAALVEDHIAKMQSALTQSLSASATAAASGTTVTLDARAKQLVRGVITAYRVDPQLDHVLCQEVPKVGELQRVYGFEQYLAERCRAHLFSDAGVRPLDIERAVFLLVNAVPGVVRASVKEDPRGEADDRLADELTDMIVRYLKAQPSS
jgi:AcrR family transcriptional regulator